MDLTDEMVSACIDACATTAAHHISPSEQAITSVGGASEYATVLRFTGLYPYLYVLIVLNVVPHP